MPLLQWKRNNYSGSSVPSKIKVPTHSCFSDDLLDEVGCVRYRLLAAPDVRGVLVRSRARRTKRYHSTARKVVMTEIVEIITLLWVSSGLLQG